MTEDTVRRAYDLVEELRAEIDFEIDEVIAEIIRDLPDDYFSRLRRADQLKHLKTLLAISVCQLDNEIVLRSQDERQIAVIARQNYPGLLAKIVKGLPSDHPLIEAQIFTSKAHKFIIDLFEFDCLDDQSTEPAPVVPPHEVENSIDQVALLLGVEREVIANFVGHYPRSSQVLTSIDEIKQHFQAYVQLEETGRPFYKWRIESEATAKLVVATSHMTAHQVFYRTARFLADKSLDIEEAFLNELSVGGTGNAAIASFSVSSELRTLTEATLAVEELASFLAKSIA